jgi:hypothetical protein
MQIRGLLFFCIAFLTCVASPALATMRIYEDHGGQIGQYLQAFCELRSSGENVVVDGNCLSACTLLLGAIPRGRICATERARFGFHAAWMPDANGRPVTSGMGTQALWDSYPGSVRRWINRHGGLSRRMIYLQGRELTDIVPICDRPEQRVHLRSARRQLPVPSSYERAAADSYSR